MGSSTSLQSLYELKRHEKTFKNAELIITESNLNEIGNHNHPYEKLSLKLIARNISLFYEELFTLNKKIVIILLPISMQNTKLINNLHKQNALKFGFNLIDIQRYYENKDLIEFGERIDISHQQAKIMCEFGKNILKNIENFSKPKDIKIKKSSPQFAICTPKEMQAISKEKPEILNLKNSAFNEITYRLNKDIILQFPNQFKNYHLVGLHTWNTHNAVTCWQNAVYYCSSVVIKNNIFEIIKETSALNQVIEIQNMKFLIDEKSLVFFNYQKKQVTEYFVAAQSWHETSKQLDYIDIIAFFLAKFDEDYEIPKIDFESLANEEITLPKEYDFSYLIPPVEVYKEIIDEYCSIMDPKKFATLQNKITELQNKTNILTPQNSAVLRIKNHLAYKLGSAMIENSKSIKGYIRLPYVLSYISDKHKIEQEKYEKAIKENPNLALPSLETYPDYKEALKCKEHLSYKLGEAFIKAYKNVWKGGLIKFVFVDIGKIRREIRERKS